MAILKSHFNTNIVHWTGVIDDLSRIYTTIKQIVYHDNRFEISKIVKKYLYTQKTFHQESRYMIRNYSFFFKRALCVINLLHHFQNGQIQNWRKPEQLREEKTTTPICRKSLYYIHFILLHISKAGSKFTNYVVIAFDCICKSIYNPPQPAHL